MKRPTESDIRAIVTVLVSNTDSVKLMESRGVAPAEVVAVGELAIAALLMIAVGEQAVRAFTKG